MLVPLSLGLVLVLLVASAEEVPAKHKIPNYIHICKRNDPDLEKCILNSVERLRPILKTGIPELEVPGLEPLILPVVEVSRDSRFRARGTNVTVRGASDFRVTRLKADLNSTKFFIGIEIPFLLFNAQYDMNARVLVIPLKGKGPVKANATDVIGDGVLKGKKVQRNGDTYLDFTDLKLSLEISNYNVRLENLFNGNRQLGEAINIALNENKREFMEALRPIVERVVSNVLLDIARKITKNFTFDELFPID